MEAHPCQEENERVLLCYGRGKDWRECRRELEAFRKCFSSHQQEGGPVEDRSGELAR